MEGPSLVILKEEAAKFVGRRVTACSTTVQTIDCLRLQRQKLVELTSWGKHFLLRFEKSVLRIHFLMFGSYWIDTPRAHGVPKLSLTFATGAIHFYSCAVQNVLEPLEELYDWRVDVMSPLWHEKRVRQLVDAQPDAELGDVLLDQNVFAGVGNIIKNEVLFNVRLQPETKVRTLLPAERLGLVREAHAYSWRFYEWKKAYVLKRNWQIYRKRVCPLCQSAVIMRKTGVLQRVSFYCERCQVLRKRVRRSA